MLLKTNWLSLLGHFLLGSAHSWCSTYTSKFLMPFSSNVAYVCVCACAHCFELLEKGFFLDSFLRAFYIAVSYIATCDILHWNIQLQAVVGVCSLVLPAD
uniref:Putative secreted protein n=1 Tax=Ixodes scapularis TaxID=6945 RepID=A0A4D5S0Z2_IXOSC